MEAEVTPQGLADKGYLITEEEAIQADEERHIAEEDAIQADEERHTTEEDSIQTDEERHTTEEDAIQADKECHITKEDAIQADEECHIAEEDAIQDKIQALVTTICIKQSQCAILYLNEEKQQVEHYGTSMGKNFLLDHQDFTQQFLSYCYKGTLRETKKRKASDDNRSSDDKIEDKKRKASDDDQSSNDKIEDKKRKLSTSSDDAVEHDYILPEIQTSEELLPIPDDSAFVLGNQENGDSGQFSKKSKFPKIVLTRVEQSDQSRKVMEKRVVGRRKSALKFKEFMASIGKNKEKKNTKKKANTDTDITLEAGDNEEKVSGNVEGKKKEEISTEENSGDHKNSESSSKSKLKKTERKTDNKGQKRVLLGKKVDASSSDTKKLATVKRKRASTKKSVQNKDDGEEFDEVEDDENDENWEAIDDKEDKDFDYKKRKRNPTSSVKKKRKKKLSVKSEPDIKKDYDVNIEPKCLECKKEFKCLSGLNSHISSTGHLQICTFETDYLCYTCNVYFLRMVDLTRHMEKTSHTGNAAHEIERKVQNVIPRKENRKTLSHFKCSMCKAEYRHRKNCEEHIKLAKCQPKRYKKCPCCTRYFENKNLLRVHLKKKHRDEYPFTCPVCHQQFFKWIALETHKRIHKKAEYQSTVLKQEIGQDLRDGTVEEVNTEENSRQDADDAGNTEGVVEVENPSLQDIFTENIHKYLRLKYIKKIQRQLRGIADKDTVVSDVLDCEQICMICSEKFTNYSTLKVHIMSTNHEQVTEEETGYKCYTCNKYFVKFADLEGHMERSSHTGNPPGSKLKGPVKVEKKDPQKVSQEYKCSLCSTEFPTLAKCEEHTANCSCEKYYRKKCECCELCFTKKNLYHAHMYQQHQFEFPFKCMRCDLEFEIMTCYLSHLRTHLKEDAIDEKDMINCETCGKKFTKKYHLIQHQKREHPDEVIGEKTKTCVNPVGSTEVTNFKCYDCQLYFSNMVSLDAHVKVVGHTGNPESSKVMTVVRTETKESTTKEKLKPFKCSKCHDRFPYRQIAERHVSKNSCVQYWRKACPICAQIFRYRNIYEAHMLEFHKDEYPFRCEDCSRIFYRSSAYNSHRVNIHDREPFRPHPEGFIEVITCEICSKTFRGRGNYNQHMRGNHGDTQKPFICEQCGARFSSQRSMKEHMNNTHDRDPNNPELMCRICQKVLKSVKTRIMHENLMHRDDKGHTCEICGFRTRRLGNLNYHIAQKHSAEPAYTCNECGLKIRVKPSYNLHMANHALERGDIETAQSYCKIHKCDVCERGFSTKQQCEKHKLKHLGDHGKLNCKICGLSIACHTSGLRKHYRQRHNLGPKDVRALIKDVPSAENLIEKIRENLKDEVPVPEVPMEERKAHPSSLKKKKKKKTTVTVKAQIEDNASYDVLDYESEENYEEYMVVPAVTSRSTPRKPVAAERDFLAEAMSQIDVLENACNPPTVTSQEVVVHSVANSEDIELIIPEGGTQLLIRDENGDLVRPQFVATSQENGAVTIRIQK